MRIEVNKLLKKLAGIATIEHESISKMSSELTWMADIHHWEFQATDHSKWHKLILEGKAVFEQQYVDCCKLKLCPLKTG